MSGAKQLIRNRNEGVPPGRKTSGDATAIAAKQAIAQQIEREMQAQRITKTMLAEKMCTSRAALNRLLDRTDTGLTLTTLASAASSLGRKLKVELVRR